MTPSPPPKLHVRGLLYAWCNIFLISMAWAPYAWFEGPHRVRSAWEFRDILGGLTTGHDLASFLLAAHALMIMVLFGLQLARD